MKDKFKQVPIDSDTKILFEQEMKLREYDVLYQKWIWDGIYGDSIIFESKDVTKLTDDEIKQLIKKLPVIKEGSDITFDRLESGFIFVNFNFEISDD